MNQETFLHTLLPLQPAMQLTAERMLHSAPDAEDIVQDVFLELWEKRDKLQHVLSLEAYAMQTVKHRCVSLLRRQRDVAVDDIERLGDFSDQEINAECARLEEQSAQLDRMMEQLPERQREAVRLRYIEQLSTEEIRQRMGMTSTHVYATLSRAVGALKSMIRK